jgi:hypothetical protein
VSIFSPKKEAGFSPFGQCLAIDHSEATSRALLPSSSPLGARRDVVDNAQSIAPRFNCRGVLVSEPSARYVSVALQRIEAFPNHDKEIMLRHVRRPEFAVVFRT